MPPKSPPRLKFTAEEVWTVKERIGYDIEAYRKGELVGELKLRRHANMPYAKVQVVNTKYPGEGLGTKLYEYAARAACVRLKVPLASDILRTSASDGFWQKQVRKGRATCVPAKRGLGNAEAWRSRMRDGSLDLDENLSGCERYILKCPAPRSLAGRRGRL